MSSATINETCGQTRSKPGFGAVPQCTIKVEKCQNGMKITCTCEDEQCAAALQEACKALSGGKLGFSCTANGMVACQCNLCMCDCNCTATQNGVCFTCTSGDKNCCATIEACCNCVCACMKAGYDCCICLDESRVCCCCAF